MPPVHLKDFTPAPWQERATDAWQEGDSRGPWRGTLEIFTGGGKTLIALMALARASVENPGVKAMVIVPSEALAHQWVEAFRKYSDVPSSEVGLMGAGGTDSPAEVRVLVAVINSAAKKLPALIDPNRDYMLIVDECHRAGAPTFRRVLGIPAKFRLGLSATPDRQELDAYGEPAPYNESVLGQELGEIVFSFGLAEATEMGWLPEYRLEHHGVALKPPERERYSALSRQIDDLADKLKQKTGRVDPRTAQRMAGEGGELAKIAGAWLGATAKRKDLLFRATERERVAIALAKRALRAPGARVLLFHERVDEASAIFSQLHGLFGNSVALEHSRLPDRERRDALLRFSTGDVQVLVSVKSLVEGIDVPAADVGISVAATSSVRQRIQSLGRVLRRSSERKVAQMDLIYVADTVDDLIYAKEDWSEATGVDLNTYWQWTLDPSEGPVQMLGPPRQPLATEDQEWERLGCSAPAEPVPWLGEIPDSEYSVDTRGTVTNASGNVIENPQGVAEMVHRARGRAGGRFRVTPRHHLVLTASPGSAGFVVAGQLPEPFAVRHEQQFGSHEFDGVSASPGDPYTGPIDDDHGSFRIRSRGGGTIERRIDARTSEIAITDGADPLARNGRRTLDAWQQAVREGLPFKVNRTWDAWYLQEGQPRFLAHVENGFKWPTEEGRSR